MIAAIDITAFVKKVKKEEDVEVEVEVENTSNDDLNMNMSMTNHAGKTFTGTSINTVASLETTDVSSTESPFDDKPRRSRRYEQYLHYHYHHHIMATLLFPQEIGRAHV